MLRRLTALLLLVGCNPDIGGQVVDRDDTDVDEEGPIIEHEPITSPQSYGQDVLIDATASDESGVTVVELLYRQETSVDWKTKNMSEVGGDLYQGRINGQDVGSGGMRYFIRGVDWLGNEACLPEDCEEEAWRFPVVP